MKAYAMTDRGRKRQLNQDAVFSSTTAVGNLPNLFLVADGMGGHAAGDFASRFTIDNLVSQIGAASGKNMISLLNESIRTVNSLLLKEANEHPELRGMGTTLVAAVLEDNVLYVANIGDSRLYVISDEIRQITRDHSLVEELVRRGEIERGSEEYLERKNIITRAIGAQKRVYADFFEVNIEEGDTILMCTDGLTNMVPDDDIYNIAAGREDVEKVASDLIDAANSKGGLDNIGVVVFRPSAEEVTTW